ncbi:MAG: hypothetical protein NT126_11695 [Bacteroidetes bacterium]|nr:hypothetical protein [Bacteroidota bacterium]
MREKSCLSSVSWFLLLVILLNLSSVSVLCLVMAGEHEEMDGIGSASFENNDAFELVKISLGVAFSENRFQQLNEHEIVYHGKLYDVVKSFRSNDFLYFYCINDRKEEKMLEQIRICTESHLDYFNSADHSSKISVKLFTQESDDVAVVSEEKSPGRFYGMARGQFFYSCLVVKTNDHPPEEMFSANPA